ncbi:DUF262 domain-containing protein [Pseudogemmatithrix spongiicola]|uniref:DUF262 domain-containing protein n=1 Tax=Pseudogemmatithrix spongiicola TaxID=3062599 RepID=A0AA49Q7A0_9BACT|nr:DUF262 domain-containing protein [Gemmatimonadaceae bacterium 'strain 138']WKW14847.1 DUF262 domain-containing protein [Gemmatimonadaceae bacterium 'strain 318']
MSEPADAEYSEDDEKSLYVDEALTDDTVVPDDYQIASYGADYDVEGLVRRIQRGDIFVPSFQRQYMWNQQEASRFVESLLLGLPVPGIFLATEPSTGKMLVIDGQQRLKTLQFFYEGSFNPKPDAKTHRLFKLVKVQKPFDGLSYKELDQRDRMKLDNAIIHATVIKQEAPKDGDTSIYHIFERLNNGGRRLAGQEIRSALYHGALIELLDSLAELPSWRRLFGARSKREKDEELLLRFFALHFASSAYEKPMTEFLNQFAAKNRNPSPETLDAWRQLVVDTLDLIEKSLGLTAFRIGKPLNAALCDAIMVGVAARLQHSPAPREDALRKAYQELMASDAFMQAVTRATSDEQSVSTRLELARKAFAAT